MGIGIGLRIIVVGQSESRGERYPKDGEIEREGPPTNTKVSCRHELAGLCASQA